MTVLDVVQSVPALAWAVLAYAGLVLLPANRKRRILNLLIALDQVAWVVLTLGNGSPDETISAAAWRMEQQGNIAGRILRPLIDLLFRPLERDHCRLSFLAEIRKTQLPPIYRDQHDGR